MTLRRIGVLSAAKLSCILYAAIGLLFGALVTLGAVIASVFGLGSQESMSGLGSLLFGMGAIVSLPILYGLIGLVSGAFASALYNLVAGWIGGLELDLESHP
jgi:hypothetical protein